MVGACAQELDWRKPRTGRIIGCDRIDGAAQFVMLQHEHEHPREVVDVDPWDELSSRSERPADAKAEGETHSAKRSTLTEDDSNAEIRRA